MLPTMDHVSLIYMQPSHNSNNDIQIYVSMDTICSRVFVAVCRLKMYYDGKWELKRGGRKSAKERTVKDKSRFDGPSLSHFNFGKVFF